MVFLVEDFVNLPADQICNIWLAAHMKRKLNKKDIKKTKLASACSQLHSDKTKKPMQLRHYGQCLIGISWIHYKQVEYLHNDCNEAFSKARLVFVRKRNVDLDPSKGRARDITLPQQKEDNNNLELMDIDLNAANNLSQLYLDDDNASDIGSLLGSVSHLGRNDLALDAEITMQQNELSTVSPNRLRDRRSSFGGISSLLMGDMDIEIKFDDDDDEDNAAADHLDESQASQVNADHLASLTDTDDDNGSIGVERGRGNNDTLMFQEQNITEVGMMADDRSVTDTGSHVSFEKEKGNILDNISVHSGSVMDVMDIDIQDDEQSLHSIHVGFDMDQASVDGSVATMDLREDHGVHGERASATPPVAVDREKTPKKKIKKKKTKKRKKKRRFETDKQIELERDELRVRNMDTAEFVYPAGRDPMHIWREFPLSTLDFDDLLYQPLSKQHFGKLPADILAQFAICNKEQCVRKEDIDELGNVDILKENADIEKGRDDAHDMDDVIEDIHDLSLPMNDNMDLLNESMEDEAEIMEEGRAALKGDDDNASVLESVVNDAIPAPDDPLFDDDALSMNDEDDDIDMNVHKDSNHLSFDTNDENILTQMDSDEVGIGSSIKPRDWSRRARKTFSFFKRKQGKEFSFNELMTAETKRNTVVGVFYELLVFKNCGLVDLDQDEPFGDITITKTDNFYRHERVSQKLSQRV